MRSLTRLSGAGRSRSLERHDRIFYPTRFASPQGSLIPLKPQESLILYRPPSLLILSHRVRLRDRQPMYAF